jgi:hypothetical protein
VLLDSSRNPQRTALEPQIPNFSEISSWPKMCADRGVSVRRSDLRNDEVSS